MKPCSGAMKISKKDPDSAMDYASETSHCACCYLPQLLMPACL